MYALTCDQPFQIVSGQINCPGSIASVLSASDFTASQLDPVAVVDAIGSGFIVAGVPLLTIVLFRMVLNQFKLKR